MTTSLPKEMKAIKVLEKGHAEVQIVPLPRLRDDYILVKTHSLALNPTDWKHIHNLGPVGSTIGCDYSGTVVSIGSKVKKQFYEGDKVAGFIHGGNASEKEDGAFGEYAVAKGDIQMKVTQKMEQQGLNMEGASTLGVGISTVGQGLYQSLGLPWPNKPSAEKFPVLIYGGSTATGALAIQCAKLSGLGVITTCSPRNFDYVKSLGADAAFDYNSPICGEDIRKHTNDKLNYAFDCISEGSAPGICCAALSSSSSITKPKYSSLLAVKDFPRDDVEHLYTLAYTGVGEAFKKGPREFEAKPDHKEFQEKFWDVAAQLFEEGKLKVHKPDVRSSGLQGVLQGLDDLKNGKVSGTKLVYNVE